MMKIKTPAATAAAVYTEKKIEQIKQNPWIRAGAFALSVTAGFLLARLLHAGFTWLPTLCNGTQDKASPLMAILKLLRSD